MLNHTVTPFQKQIMTQLITEMLQDGVSPKAEKIAAIQQWPQPTSFTTIRAFLGLTGYYRLFVQHYVQIAAPLTEILKMKEFRWTEDADAVFKELKQHMQQLITLVLPNITKTFDVTTDASSMAIGAVLTQENKPIAFFSKKLCPTMQGQFTYTKEFYAITEAVKKWRQYLLGRRFSIYTDLKIYA
nr:Ty3/gypsy retrotransposon protein [Tanacetum cinerariifolium]